MANKQRKLKLSFLALILAIVFVFSAQRNGAIAEKAPDSIGLRVIENPYHYSPAVWYAKQGYTNTLKTLMIDGYDAGRYGRSVYVNAANIAGGKYYSNIYIFSYDQNADSNTIEIFERILKTWKFTANLTASGKCSISSFPCSDSSACQSGESCANRKCLPAAIKSCYVDSDCADGYYCDSQKAKVARDTRRLSALADIKSLLENYKFNNGIYPALSSGTYLPNRTISVWPSWSDNLASLLNSEGGISSDPVNVLGNCGEDRFSPVTCWDDGAKEFAGNFNSDGGQSFPAGSLVLSYMALNEGKAFKLCGSFESGLIDSAEVCLENETK